MRKARQYRPASSGRIELSASSHCEILDATLSPHQTASVLAKARLRPETRTAVRSAALEMKCREVVKVLS